MGFSITDMLNKDTSMAAAPVKEHTVERISYSKLVPSEDNFYSMQEIEELKTAIELAGRVLNNLVVTPLEDGKYKILSGHRRHLRLLLAAQFQARVDPEADILSNGQMVKQVILLKQHRDRTLRRRRRVMRLAVNQQAAAGGRQKPGYSIQQGALSGAAGAKHRDALAARDVESKAHRQMLVQPGHIIEF